ncbi:hypothetical protein GN244_ATG16718 [Phytophthora infestans]|uniref:Uncharacterized protein n=1 Tax=Phytophthora infestans TaxID=4787 RepID=A0A833STI3_PHYIN|nr:hypothetical protein GN244_ATG16718 [Phytophthora infestans]
MVCALHCALARKPGVDSTVEWLRVRQCLSAGAQRSARPVSHRWLVTGSHSVTASHKPRRAAGSSRV